jgi:hypothetical protein
VSQNSMFDDDKVEEPVSSARVALLS